MSSFTKSTHAFRSKNLLTSFVVLGLALSLLPFFLFTFFAHPYDDDFNFANQSRAGFIHFFNGFYTHMTGRYVVIFTSYWLNPLRWGYEYGSLGVKIFPFVFLVCFAFAIYQVIRVSFSYLSRVYAVFLALSMEVFFLNSLAGINEWVYWFIGANAYFLPMLILLACYVYLIKYLQKGHLSVSEALLLHFLNFAVMGTHEIIAVFHGAVLCFLAIHIHLNKSKWRISVFYLLLGAFLGLMVLVLAPGNYTRWLDIDQRFAGEVGRFSNKGVLKVMILGVYFGVSGMGNWLNNASFWILTLLLLPLMQSLVLRLGLKNSRFIHPLFHLFLLFLMFIFLHIFVLRTNFYGTVRVEALLQFLFYLGIWANLQLCMCFYAEKIEKFNAQIKEVSSKTAFSLGLICLFLVLSITPSSQNINNAYYEIAFVLPHYQAFIHQRFEILKEARGKSSAVIKRMPPQIQSKFLLVKDYQAPSSAYISRTEQYFRIKKIQLIDP